MMHVRLLIFQSEVAYNVIISSKTEKQKGFESTVSFSTLFVVLGQRYSFSRQELPVLTNLSKIFIAERKG